MMIDFFVCQKTELSISGYIALILTSLVIEHHHSESWSFFASISSL